MSVKTEKLLSLWREYEVLCRGLGKDPKTVEDERGEPDGGKLRMIRQFRNFLAHTEAPGFLEPTDKMLGFLESEVKALALLGDVAKKHLKTPAVSILDYKDTCGKACDMMSKLRRGKLAVREKDGSHTVIEIWQAAPMPRAAKLSTAKRLREKVLYVSPEAQVSGIDPERTALCTSDGTPEGKVLGTVLL